mmetsp:Transcript_97541/g.314410  ORF Transcript_97541/g.314410 Transcript_97541/m.314410 type:complete len:160 (-) Transcript_97541:1793-2272(-)
MSLSNSLKEHALIGHPTHLEDYRIQLEGSLAIVRYRRTFRLRMQPRGERGSDALFIARPPPRHDCRRLAPLHGAIVYQLELSSMPTTTLCSGDVRQGSAASTRPPPPQPTSPRPKPRPLPLLPPCGEQAEAATRGRLDLRAPTLLSECGFRGRTCLSNA